MSFGDISIRDVQDLKNVPTPESVPAVPDASDAEFRSAEETRLAREAMERDVHAQSKTLDPSALHEQHDIPAAAPTAATEAERIRGESLSVDELLAFRGRRLLDAEGSEIGEIAEVYYDEASLEPEWIGADVHGVLGARRIVAPVHGSYVLGDAISVPYDRDLVLACDANGFAITPRRERELYEHFALPYSVDRSPTGLVKGTGEVVVDTSDGSFLSEAVEDAPFLVAEVADEASVMATPAEEMIPPSQVPGGFANPPSLENVARAVHAVDQHAPWRPKLRWVAAGAASISAAALIAFVVRRRAR